MVAAESPAFTCRLCGAGGLYFHYALGRDQQCRYYKCPDCGLVNYDLSGGLEQEQYTHVLIDPADDRMPGNRDND